MGFIVEKIGEIAKDKAVEWLKKHAIDFVDENLGRGSRALGPATSDMTDVYTEVVKYWATVQSSAPILSMPPQDQVSRAKVCSVALATGEVSVAVELKDNLEKIRDRISRVSAGATRRAQSDRDGAAKRIDQAAAEQRSAEQRGLNNPAAISKIDMDTGIQVFSDTNIIIIQQQATDLLEIVDKALSKTDQVIETLNGLSAPLLQTVQRCSDWIVNGQRS